jgi:D-3-phosphoglycerate dehydrogenase
MAFPGAPMSSPRILVNSSTFAESALRRLAARGASFRYVPTTASVAEMIEVLADGGADAIISRATPVTAAVMDAARSLKIVAKFGAGYDNVDLTAAAARGIVVSRAHGANARSVAELAFAMMLILSRRLLSLDHSVRAGRWERSGPLGGEITGKTLGIVGCGAVGTQVAAVSRGFDMRLLVYDPYILDFALPPRAERVARLDDLLEQSDVVTLHCPLADETSGMIGAAELRRMKPTAFLINAARGPVVDEAALVRALDEHRIAGAGLDTFATEPPDPSSALWAMPNVVFSPHIGASTAEASERVAILAVENILAVLGGRLPDPSCLVVPASGAPR